MNAGIKNITAEIHALIDQQIDADIAVNKIVLAGFSQGGALTLHAGLTYSQPLAGLMALVLLFATTRCKSDKSTQSCIT